MSELRDRMDELGWSSPSENPDHQYLMFKWMREATSEIERLQREVESLTRVLNSRTEHLV